MKIRTEQAEEKIINNTERKQINNEMNINTTNNARHVVKNFACDLDQHMYNNTSNKA